MLIRVIGIGSPFGDDVVGLEAAQVLAKNPPPDCEVIAADRPGAGLIELLDGAGAAILIDAVRSGSPPGTLHELSFDDLDACAAQFLSRTTHSLCAFVSSHDLSVAASVQLARKLGRAPRDGRVLGIEIAPTRHASLASLSENAQQALRRALVRVRLLAEEMAAKTAQISPVSPGNYLRAAKT
jgi:hydrogenase maturation protease